jgi:hypothetical protein
MKGLPETLKHFSIAASKTGEEGEEGETSTVEGSQLGEL